MEIRLKNHADALIFHAFPRTQVFSEWEISMRVLFYRYGSICEPDIIEALTQLSFTVDEIDDEIYNKNITPAESIQTVRRRLDNAGSSSSGYTFIFTVNYFPWLSEVCSIYGILYFSLIVDSPVMELYSDSIKHSCNRVFLFDRCLYNEFAPQNPGHIFHIPLATNTERSRRVIENASDDSKRRFSSDISFIGSLYTEKCLYNGVSLPEYEKGFAEGLIEAQLNVYGYNFIEECLTDEFVKTFLANAPGHYEFPANSRHAFKALVAQQYISVKAAEQERIRALTMLSRDFNVDLYTGSDTSGMPRVHNRGFAKSLTEMPLIFSQSKINLNITAKSIRSGLSLRIFDILGCGGFLITNYQAELPEFFELGVELETYSSMEELHDKCAYYLSHDSERRAIARRGYEKTAARHSYATRLLQMMDMASKSSN